MLVKLKQHLIMFALTREIQQNIYFLCRLIFGHEWVKILNGYENIDSNLFFEIKESKITRGHNFTLVKKQSRLHVRKFSFSQRTINVLNK